MLVAPGVPKGTPAVITSRSPGPANPSSEATRVASFVVREEP